MGTMMLERALEELERARRQIGLPEAACVPTAARAELEAVRKAAKALLTSDTSIRHFLGGYDPTVHHGLSQPWVDAVALLQSIAKEGP